VRRFNADDVGVTDPLRKFPRATRKTRALGCTEEAKALRERYGSQSLRKGLF
jgi:hypothetical protein